MWELYLNKDLIINFILINNIDECILKSVFYDISCCRL